MTSSESQTQKEIKEAEAQMTSSEAKHKKKLLN